LALNGSSERSESLALNGSSERSESLALNESSVMRTETSVSMSGSWVKSGTTGNAPLD